MTKLIWEIKAIINNLFENPRDPVHIEQLKVRSFTECPECPEKVNDGYFKITSSKSNDTIVMSYDSFHVMDKHLIYTKGLEATDKRLSELERENEMKNPRDQLNFKELQAQIKEYSLDELHQTLKKMLEE